LESKLIWEQSFIYWRAAVPKAFFNAFNMELGY
jgi:hypothetical protein